MNLDELRPLVGKRVLITTYHGREMAGELIDWDFENSSVSVADDATGIPYMFKVCTTSILPTRINPNYPGTLAQIAQLR